MARKYYPYDIDKQPKQVRPFVKSNWGGLQKYGDTEREAIAPNPAHHRMTKAKGGLKKAWGASREASLKNKDLVRSARKKAKSTAGAKKVIMRMHFVKFGADPYHK